MLGFVPYPSLRATLAGPRRGLRAGGHYLRDIVRARQNRAGLATELIPLLFFFCEVPAGCAAGEINQMVVLQKCWCNRF